MTAKGKVLFPPRKCKVFNVTPDGSGRSIAEKLEVEINAWLTTLPDYVSPSFHFSQAASGPDAEGFFTQSLSVLVIYRE